MPDQDQMWHTGFPTHPQGQFHGHWYVDVSALRHPAEVTNDSIRTSYIIPPRLCEAVGLAAKSTNSSDRMKKHNGHSEEKILQPEAGLLVLHTPTIKQVRETRVRCFWLRRKKTIDPMKNPEDDEDEWLDVKDSRGESSNGVGEVLSRLENAL